MDNVLRIIGGKVRSHQRAIGPAVMVIYPIVVIMFVVGLPLAVILIAWIWMIERRGV